MHFSEGGGYERREWWTREGWAWKQEYDITHHPAISAGHPEAAACHVSWFEADAFAKAHGARLPTEREWEKAATWEQDSNGERPAGSAGALAAVGQVWEWTASHFHGYPGFRAFPYREYSEVFFGERYRVLRGSSWATDARVASTTFRNWDLPLRRQIFAGVRLAREL
jgi:iron(II)-dependent oxidoreductase